MQSSNMESPEYISAFTVNEELIEEYAVETEESSFSDMDVGNRPIGISEASAISNPASEDISVNDYLRRLINRNYPNASTVQCLLCGLLFKLRTKFASTNVTQLKIHLYWHLNIPLFSCRYCDQAATTPGPMSNHVRKKHRAATSCAIHYVDKSDQYREEIFKLADQCFGLNPDAQNRLSSTATEDASAIDIIQEVISLTNAATKHVKDVTPIDIQQNRERRFEYLRNRRMAQECTGTPTSPVSTTSSGENNPFTSLIEYCEVVLLDNYSRVGNRLLECLLCKRLVGVNQKPELASLGSNWARNAFHHSLSHLTPPIYTYRCCLCSYSANWKPHIEKHLTVLHPSSGSDQIQFNELTDDQRSTAIDAIDQCFDAGLNEATNESNPIATVKETAAETDESDQASTFRRIAHIKFCRIRKRIFRCSKCRLPLRFKILLKMHMKRVHGEK